MVVLHRPLYKVSFHVWGEGGWASDGAKAPSPSGYAPEFAGQIRNPNGLDSSLT